tara:strand:+ start:369 stop:758 length:390 start_codon:yes stop_codon:yes gene_type:complete
MILAGMRIQQKIYILLLIVSVIIFIIFRFPYREFIYENNYFDFYIADVAPNFWAVPMYFFFKKSFKKSPSNIRLALGSFLGLVVYEIWIQKYIYNATLDYLDILASLISSIVFYFLCEYLDKKLHKTNV